MNVLERKNRDNRLKDALVSAREISTKSRHGGAKRGGSRV
jgi:hypothetical protein